MEKDKKIYWLDGFEGKARGGTFYRSRIHLDIDEFETRFNKKVVAVGLNPDYSSGKPSWTVEFIVDATDELNEIKETEEIKTIERD